MRDVADTAPSIGEESESPADSIYLQYLARAAEAAALAGVDLDQFMASAWVAFMDARPGLREQLEHMQLIAQLESLRAQGRLGQA